MARRYREQMRKQEAEEEAKLPSYSDFKYVMISIPLAIALLFFILNKSSTNQEHRLTEKQVETLMRPTPSVNSNIPQPETNTLKVDMSISPLQSFFSPPEFDSVTGAVLRIENPGETDVVACLVSQKTKRVIRNCYVNAGYFFLMDKIPQGNYMLQLMYGKNWNAANKNPVDTTKQGMFDSLKLYARLPIGYINAKSLREAKAFPYKENKRVVVMSLAEVKKTDIVSATQFFYPNKRKQQLH